MDFTPNQIEKLKSLGINIESEKLEIRNLKFEIKPKKTNSFVPLLSISGLTLISFSGLILFKTKNTNPPTIHSPNQPSNVSPSPTQVPKSIQHYLLTSQQYFSRALQAQSSKSSTVELLNNSILAATDAIKEFPQDSRGYYQRAKIYQSLIDSKPEFLNQAIADLSTAQKLDSNSYDITHDLASLFAKKGDAQNTITYLNQTISLDPTKAQNFYDLAKIQQQAGFLPQALETYNRLMPLISDPQQLAQVKSEKIALEKLVTDNPSLKNNVYSSPTPSDSAPTIDSPTIQATDITNNTGLIIAAPETAQKIEVSNQTDSNSLSGSGTILANQKEITISNSKLQSSSQVYVTLTKGGKNKTLKVLSKSKDSFVVGFDQALSETVEFKWWIIN
ncbi:MAG: tetratricopeptide repeat protein [Candidatus Shapirobacteria bacterium]